MKDDKLIYASDARKAVLKAAPHAAYCIDSIPTVDAVEVVYGKWHDIYLISNGQSTGICSVCRKKAIFPANMILGTDYCPNCGSKNN